MKFIGFSKLFVAITVIGALMAGMAIQAQIQKPTAQNPPQGGTIRVKVGLVQTDVSSII